MPNDFIDDAAEGVGPVDTINYFCEVEYERELERLRAASVAPPKEVIETEKLRDSVVLLPKIQKYVDQFYQLFNFNTALYFMI